MPSSTVPRRSARVTSLVLLILGSALSTVALFGANQQQPQVPGAFRTRITIVPLDVRVLDANGKPVTDLTQEDFSIFEDGIFQKIGHFATQALLAQADTPANQAAQEPLLRRGTGALKAQNRRIFLVQLGRGRLKGPSKEMPALLDFIRTRLLPQDLIAVLAYNRATDFTTNHAAMLGLVERYRDRHEKIEGLLEQHFSGLRAIYGSKEIPPNIQVEIDAVFNEARNLRPREIRPGQITDARQIADDTRQTAQELQRAELLRERTGDFAGLPDPAATATAERLDVSFDQYIADQVELMQDLGNLYAGIDYMRYVEGEKHLVFVTPRGLSLPRIENDRSIGVAASDARVAIDIIFTGGVVGAPTPRFEPPTGSRGGRIVMSPLPTSAASFGQSFNIQALRYVSELTGGQTTAFRFADYAFDRLDAATRFQYLLGYYPTDARVDGRLRRIVVKVNRPGVTVLYRRGYYASEQLVPLDRQQFITYSRITAAGRYQGVVRDIQVTLKPPTVSGDGANRELVMEVNIQSPRIAFTQVDGRHVASVDIAIYCGDAKEKVVCDTSQKMDLKLSDESFQRFAKEGATYTARVRLSGEPFYVKVIAYDYAADIVGTASHKIK
jgi:VWFA-related protein